MSQNLPNYPTSFIFTDIDLKDLAKDPDLKIKGKRKLCKGVLPVPQRVVDEKNLFTLYSWDVFFNIGTLLRERLKGSYPQRKDANGNSPLFTFSFEEESGLFSLSLKKEWVQKTLKLPPVISVKNNCPWKAHIVFMGNLRHLIR